MAESSNATTGSVQNESTTKSTGSTPNGAWDFSKLSTPFGGNIKDIADSTIKSDKSLLPNKGPSSGSSSSSDSSSGSSSSSDSSSSSSSESSNNTLKNLSNVRQKIRSDNAWRELTRPRPINGYLNGHLLASQYGSDKPLYDPDWKIKNEIALRQRINSKLGDTKNGDYETISNEKSEVKTGTLGKQSDIVTSPTLTEENKGLVDNPIIESVEGIVTKQKDKASQEVLDAKKKRDEAEEEDKTDKIKGQLNADGESSDIKSPTNNDEIDSAFKAEDDKRLEDLNTKQQTVNQKQKDLENKQQELKDIEKERDLMQWELDSLSRSIEDQEKNINNLDQTYDRIATEIREINSTGGIKGLLKAFDIKGRNEELQKYVNELNELSYNNGSSFKIDDNPHIMNIDELFIQIAESKNKVLNIQNRALDNSRANLAYEQAQFDEMNTLYDNTSKEVDALQEAAATAQNDLDNTQKDYDAWKSSTNAKAPESNEISPEPTVEPEVVEEVVTEAPPETPAPEDSSSSLKETADNLRNKYEGEEWAEEAAQNLENLNESQAQLHKTIQVIEEKGLENCTPEEIEDYIKAQKEYNKNLKAVLNNGRAYEQHDLNKDFVRAVAKANDFDVTLPDGSKVSYSDFASDMVVESPKIAEAMYNTKAEQYEQGGHKILATIERAKAKMAQTFLGSKLTFADNQVRDQFNQMADTNMRATYAAYNNVLNDPDASEAQKAEASTQISQAQSLKTASAALKASTGFFSGLSDSTSDGIYGTVDPGTLNTYQETLNGIKSFAQIALGLGISPAANKAYQNLYYLNKDYPNKEGSILAKDFDKDGFAWVEEYGNNAAAGMILAGGELATGIALMFNPATVANGTNLILDSIQNFMNSLYGVRGNAVKASSMTEEILSSFEEAKTLNGLPKEASDVIDNAIVQIENFELKSDEVANLDNWLEGSGSNTADNNKFNQSLTYDEWLKLIESDETLRNYAKQLVDKKKEEKV